MRCHACGSELVPMVTDLPVLQCSGCSEYLLEDAVMERVDEILGRANAQAELEIIRFAA